ncbi:hypothetical protein B296_00030877, partial [Ensete ventricosum]
DTYDTLFFIVDLHAMSKSAPSDQSRINLLDTKDVIANKIKRCKTDSYPGKPCESCLLSGPDPVMSLDQFSVCEKFSYKVFAIFPYLQEVEHECRDMNWGTFKATLADTLIDHLLPIQVTFGYHYTIVCSNATTDCGSLPTQARYLEITSDPAYLDQILSEGARKAADIAETTLNNVYQAMGFLRR